MANSKIKNSYLCHVTKLMTSSGLFQKENYFYVFDQCFWHVLDQALQNLEHMLKSFLLASHNWKQNWKTPTGSFFIVVFV